MKSMIIILNCTPCTFSMVITKTPVARGHT
jgi:hypothetical protein